MTVGGGWGQPFGFKYWSTDGPPAPTHPYNSPRWLRLCRCAADSLSPSPLLQAGIRGAALARKLTRMWWSWPAAGLRYSHAVRPNPAPRPITLTRLLRPDCGVCVRPAGERPHVVLGKDRTPVGLTNGVTEAWPCTLEHVPDRPVRRPSPFVISRELL